MERIDTEALQTLIDSHGAALKLYARQWCHAPDDALQEALIELLRQDPVPDQPVAWLFKTIRHRAMNLTRGERRRSEHHRQARQQRGEWFSDGESLGFGSEELQDALSRLPDLEREIVVARIWGELSFERVADLVGISSSSAHRRYRGALQPSRPDQGFAQFRRNVACGSCRNCAKPWSGLLIRSCPRYYHRLKSTEIKQ